MGCLLFCIKKKKENSQLNQPLCNENNDTKINIINNPIIPVNESNIENTNENANENTNENNINNNILSNNETKSKQFDYSNIVFNKKGLNLNENIEDDEPLLSPDSPLICDYEKNVITFTKNGLIKLFDNLWALDNFKKVYEKDNLLIEIRYEGTPMNDKFYLIKMKYELPKSDLEYNKDIESIMDYCYELDLRRMWDEALKSIEKYEGNDNVYIVCTWGKSPVFFVSERETIEKRFRFNHGNSTYVMSTIIPLDIYEPKEGVVRFVDYLNLFKVSDAGENILFTSLNQVDFKMPIPQMLINITLPTTSRNWYNSIKKFSNSIIWDREKKTYEKKEDDE